MGCVADTYINCDTCKEKIMDIKLDCGHKYCKECIEMEIKLAL